MTAPRLSGCIIGHPCQSRQAAASPVAARGWRAPQPPAPAPHGTITHTPSLLARRGANFRDGVARELVGALVHQVAGMASNPVPAHVVALERGVEPLPQVDILDRLLVGCAPAVALPIADP